MFEGYDLFAFGPGPGNITQIVIDIGLILFTLLWVIVNKKIAKKKR